MLTHSISKSLQTDQYMETDTQPPSAPAWFQFVSEPNLKFTIVLFTTSCWKLCRTQLTALIALSFFRLRARLLPLKRSTITSVLPQELHLSSLSGHSLLPQTCRSRLQNRYLSQTSQQTPSERCFPLPLMKRRPHHKFNITAARIPQTVVSE